MKIAAKQYATALYEAVRDRKKNEVKSIIEDFVKFIIANNDISKADKMIDEFNNVWNKEQGIVEAEIISARELDRRMVSWLRSFVVSLSRAKEVEVAQKIDKNLLGGIVVKYEDRVLDGSLRTRLKELKEDMVK